MNKLLLTLGTVLLISGCSKEPNIYLNCLTEGGYNFQFTIDTSKKEFIFYEGSEGLVNSYTDDGDKLISEKVFINWEARFDKQRKEMDVPDWETYFMATKNKLDNGFDEYYMYTFNKINGDLVESDFQKDKEETTNTYSCSVIKRVME
tara:strand:+ start:1335 stop:1778 length:444 start_codon:yes stop_codon:yes gene_type:complete